MKIGELENCCNFAVMNFAKMRQRLKPWMLPISMAGGVVFHDAIDRIAWVAPWLIFVMLLITFCRVNMKDFKVGRFHWLLLAVQVVGGIVVYFSLRGWSEDVAQGAFICVFCPTATAAPVITGMLGGSVALLVTYSLMSNVAVALLAPALFSMMGPTGDMTFWSSVGLICQKVAPLIIVPLVAALLLKRVAPRVHSAIGGHQGLSFYIWAVSLFIVVGRAVSFVMAEPSSEIPEMVVIALASGAVCCGQFYIGRRVGRRYGDKISGAQGLGQKNTVLAIWMALTYLNPIASVGPAAYVAWQNTINSLQLYVKARKGEL